MVQLLIYQAIVTVQIIHNKIFQHVFVYFFIHNVRKKSISVQDNKYNLNNKTLISRLSLAYSIFEGIFNGKKKTYYMHQYKGQGMKNLPKPN